MKVEERRRLIESGHGELSILKQCELLDLHRSNYYYAPVKISEETARIMRRIDEIFTECPFFGSRKIRVALRREGFRIGGKRVQSFMRQMRLRAIYPRAKTSRKHLGHKIYPYLLGDMKIDNPDQVWGTDITYIRLRQGFLYLVAIIDWFSRYVLSWRLSNSLDVNFCTEALQDALEKALEECEI